jgi:hypothetical protein
MSLKTTTKKKLADVKSRGKKAGELLVVDRAAKLSPLENEVRVRNEKGHDAEEKGDVILGQAENHYISAGVTLAKIKDITGTGEAWEQAAKRCGMDRPWADTLIHIGNGDTTLAEVRGKAALRKALQRENDTKEVEDKTPAQLLKAAKNLVGSMGADAAYQLVDHIWSIYPRDAK